jgi:hypothetical protein
MVRRVAAHASEGWCRDELQPRAELAAGTAADTFNPTGRATAVHGTDYTLRTPRTFPCSLQRLSDHLRGGVMWDLPRRTKGSASVQCWSAWHMMAAFSVRWKRSTSPLAAGWWAVVRESWMPQSLAREWKSWDSNCRPWSVVMVCGQPKRDIHM